jgi:hypothetical protein
METTATRSTSCSLVPLPVSICSLRRFPRIRLSMVPGEAWRRWISTRRQISQQILQPAPRSGGAATRILPVRPPHAARSPRSGRGGGRVGEGLEDSWILELIHVDMVLADAVAWSKLPWIWSWIPCRTSRCLIWFGQSWRLPAATLLMIGMAMTMTTWKKLPKGAPM